MKRQVLHILVLMTGLIVVAVTAFLILASLPQRPTQEALSALASGNDVVVELAPWLTFRPQEVVSGEPEMGLIFYPGGRVDARAYATLARRIAAEGAMVIVVPMPLHLAFFAPTRATDVIAAHPEVNTWAVGGHSLGGAMAARYVAREGQDIEGLVLWASYPAESDTMSARDDLAVLSVYATRDGLMTTDDLLASRDRLPVGATCWVGIEGGNHAQFGSYGTQPRDNAATISAAEQHREIVGATTAFLDALSQDRAPTEVSSLAPCERFADLLP